MKHTELLSYLISSLRDVGLLRYDKDFLVYIGIEKECVFAKQLHGFLQRKGDIQNKLFLKAIEEKFGFHKSIWNVCESSQIQRVKEAIEDALTFQQLPSEDALNISKVINLKTPITKKQIQQLELFELTTTKKEMENTIDILLNDGLFNKKPENQEFLVKFLTLTYDKGLYNIIVEFILPSLYRTYLLLPEVQKIEAHTLGSLGKYNDAISILEDLVHHNTIENINLRTAALSNHKRQLFEDSLTPLNKEKLYTLIQGYNTLHAINGIYSYYTGINLLYMVILGQILFPEDKRFNSIDTQEIYNKSKPSLKQDKTHHDYYMNMSGFEFQLLLGRDGVQEKIESFLSNEEPHVSLIERTLRQMELFVNASRSPQNSIVSTYLKSIGILQDYIKV